MMKNLANEFGLPYKIYNSMDTLLEHPIEDEFTILETETDDIAGMVIFTYMYYFRWKDKFKNNFIYLLNYETCKNNMSLHLWEINNHAAATAIYSKDSPDIIKYMSRLLKLYISGEL